MAGVASLMSSINFEAEKYRCGHTMVFFRAGALAALEEARDGIVLKLIRWMQGEVYGRIKRREFQKKSDQRELMKVIQRNFRKYMTLRTWGWFIIIQKTKPLIGQIHLEDELRMLEEQANAKFGAYEEQLKTKARLAEENVLIQEETKALIKQLEAEQGNLSQYTEQQERATKLKIKFEADLVAAGQKFVQMEEERAQATADKKVLEGETQVIKKDIEDIELAIQKLEQEKTNRDHTIRHLNDEIANQDEVINKLNKEKKHMAEVSAKANEDLQTAGDKVDHLANIKSKKELEGSIGRKEKDLASLSSKLEDEQSIVAKTQKTIKEIGARVEELEEELEAERKRSDLARELEQLGERLNEAGGATAAQVELNKKREAEVQKLRKDLEEAHIQQEATMINLKRKHQDAVAEMSEQIDQLAKMKAKIEKDKSQINHEVVDIRAATDEVTRSKASAEKSNKNLIGQLNEVNKKVEEANLTLGDFENAKRKLAAENADILRQLQELENSANMLAKYKAQLISQLEETKKVADEEAKERHSLLGKFKNLEHEVDGAKEQLDEEVGLKEDTLRQLNKACQE